MSNINPSDLPIVINIESKDYAPEDGEWQRECHQLYVRIKNALNEETVEPLKMEEKEKGHRGGLLEVFSTITAGVASVGGLKVIIDVAKLWLEHRKGCEITLELPGGGTLKLSGASQSDIDRVLRLYEKQLAGQGSN